MRRILPAVVLGCGLAGCNGGSAPSAMDGDAELASVVREVQEASTVVEAVGAGRDGGLANLTITVTSDSTAAQAADLLNEGVRALWQSELEPLTGIRVVVTPGKRADGGELVADLVYDERDLESVRPELVEKYGSR